MSGADWGSAFLLADFKRKAGLQDASELDDTADLYPMLSVAQRKVINRLASICPNALYQQPIAMTMSVDRKTATFGIDGNGNAVYPVGNVQIATSLRAFSGEPFSGLVVDRDFYDEGATVRCVGDRVFPRPLFARFIPRAPDITAAVAPIINPPEVREFIARQATIDLSENGGLKPAIVSAQERGWDRDWPATCLMYKKRYKNGGGLIDPARWYFAAPDLGSSV